MSISFSHREFCEIGAKWLKKACPERCPVVFIELVATSLETPDVFGLNSNHSVLLEVKRTRTDFFADKKKIVRIHPERGVGDFRLYLCPQGLVLPEDVPEMWGLIWADEKGKCEIVKQIFTGNINSGNPNRFLEKNHRSERALMYSALRRIAG